MEELNCRTRVGGAKCDYAQCHAAREEGAVLRKCSRCKIMFYCGPDCQRAAWRAGHKHACRKEGEVKVGDWVKLDGLQKRPELNDMVVEVVCEANDEGRWVVGIVGNNGNTFSVAKSKLRRVRPAA